MKSQFGKSANNKNTNDDSFRQDAFFQEIYKKGMQKSETFNDSDPRKKRFYYLTQFIEQVERLDGAIVECGCWRGLSSYVICSYLLRLRGGYKGEDYYIFDSFEGISKPTEDDALSAKTVKVLKKDFGTVEGAFTSSEKVLKNTLSDFPNVNIKKGWLPEALNGEPLRKYKFVHVDVDLYDPTLGSIQYFYPKLVAGGVLVCDDYGSKNWPGAKKAVEEFCETKYVKFKVLQSGQAVIIKRGFFGRVVENIQQRVVVPLKRLYRFSRPLLANLKTKLSRR